MSNSEMNETATAIAPPDGPKNQKTATGKGKRGARKAKLKKSAKRASPDGETKAGMILHLIGRAKGATLAELMKATGWQAHSIRGFLSTAGKRHGIRVASAKNDSGSRVYSAAK